MTILVNLNCLEVFQPILSSPISKYVSGFHIHVVDEGVQEPFVEETIGDYQGLEVRKISSNPSRPIVQGGNPKLNDIDHVGIDFYKEKQPTLEEFQALKALYPMAQIIKQNRPNCCGIKVQQKLWIFDEGKFPMEIALGPKIVTDECGCDPRPVL